MLLKSKNIVLYNENILDAKILGLLLREELQILIINLI